MRFFLFLFLSCLVLVSSFSLRPLRFFGNGKVSRVMMSDIKYDEKGYVIKTKESGWFNGLSSDPGNSLADPRAVPPVCKAFAEKVKAGTTVTFADTIALLDEHYDYFAVPFECGKMVSKANENVGSAKIFSFALMTKMDEAATLRLFGEIYRDLKPDGLDHPNIRNFIEYGWKGISFSRGLAIASKLQSGVETDEVFQTQAKLEGKGEWDTDSDSWIP